MLTWLQFFKCAHKFDKCTNDILWSCGRWKVWGVEG